MGRGAAFFHFWMRHKGTNGANWLYFAGVLCYAEGRKVGIVMREKIKQYRPVWGPLLVAVFWAELLLLTVYHVPGIEAVLGAVALDYSGSQDGKLAEYGEIKQIEKIDGKMVVTFGRTDGSPEFGAVVFERGWNGLWAPVRARTSSGYPLTAISLSDENNGEVAVFAVNCPEEAVYWDVEADSRAPQPVADPERLQPVQPSPFIQTFTLPDDPVRFVLYDAQGQELPEELTGRSSGGGKRTSFGFTNSACTVIVLGGVAVAAVRLRRLRRQERAAQQDDTQQNGQGQSKR